MVKIKKYCERCIKVSKRGNVVLEKCNMRRNYIKQNIGSKNKWIPVGWYCPRCHYFESDTNTINSNIGMISFKLTKMKWSNIIEKKIDELVEKIERYEAGSTDNILYQKALKQCISLYGNWVSFPTGIESINRNLEKFKDSPKFIYINQYIEEIMGFKNVYERKS